MPRNTNEDSFLSKMATLYFSISASLLPINIAAIFLLLSTIYIKLPF
jgi:hypothetical protein